ncbi:hypothetical protein [Sideroxydans lithotrophicus]|uniref:NERD domain-containing protein n=1 Tax=Sideroxydans lithotrophicus (strain ES-1) TaxID=580332 RepID=D5CTA5_SIDLE|nr:hypothetical protein [Sideroxydans lithotrophicus]ADE12191.1 hypothetical protein Slit_1962 [Sideroxydans lithotrophicus ES-1]
MKWTERKIAASLARQVFERKHLVLVPNCTWTGDECDLLVVTRDLRIIDVEVKISRADFKADAKKDKWFQNWDWRLDGPFRSYEERDERRRPLMWPRKVWKHYYAMPKEIWKPELAEFLPSSTSGVILLTEDKHGSTRSGVIAQVQRRATPCRDADRISPSDAVDISRLASLRMWDAFDKLDNMKEAA